MYLLFYESILTQVAEGLALTKLPELRTSYQRFAGATRLMGKDK